ncbi:MAG: TetR family transcriptional regulator [Caulobacteraceae bacterium]
MRGSRGERRKRPSARVALALVPAAAAAGDRAAPRARRVTPKSEKTRALILEAAVDAINQYGFHGANLARVAERAGLTRGAVQYYFMTGEEVMIALADHVARRIWHAYEAAALDPPGGRDLIEFAIDLVASPAEDRYRVARLELLTAARTTPALRPVLEESARMIEAQAKRFTGQIFGNPGLADIRQFRAARDLTALVNDWLFVHVFPEDRERRAADVLAALRIALHTLWRAESLDREPRMLKPRIRVKAGRDQTAPD